MQKIFQRVSSYCLVFLFTYTAVSKAIDFDFFVSQLSLYPIIETFPKITAIFIVGSEMTSVVLLLLPQTRLYGLYLTLGLLVMFTIYLTVMINTRHDLPCSCGGVIGKMTWKQHIFFNCFFIVVSMTAILLQRKKAT